MSSPELQGLLSPREQLEVTIDMLLHIAGEKGRHDYTTSLIRGSVLYESIILKDPLTHTVVTRESTLYGKTEPDPETQQSDAVAATESYVVATQNIGLTAITLSGLGWRPLDKTLPRLFDVDGYISTLEDDQLLAELAPWLAYKAEKDHIPGLVEPPDPFRLKHAQQAELYPGRELSGKEIIRILKLGAQAAYKEAIDLISAGQLTGIGDHDTPPATS